VNSIIRYSWPLQSKKPSHIRSNALSHSTLYTTGQMLSQSCVSVSHAINHTNPEWMLAIPYTCAYIEYKYTHSFFSFHPPHIPSHAAATVECCLMIIMPFDDVCPVAQNPNLILKGPTGPSCCNVLIFRKIPYPVPRPSMPDSKCIVQAMNSNRPPTRRCVRKARRDNAVPVDTLIEQLNSQSTSHPHNPESSAPASAYDPDTSIPTYLPIPSRAH
jgi:hypothetical protein